MPQLELQQTCPTLHVLRPQMKLFATKGTSQTRCEH